MKLWKIQLFSKNNVNLIYIVFIFFSFLMKITSVCFELMVVMTILLGVTGMCFNLFHIRERERKKDYSHMFIDPNIL